MTMTPTEKRQAVIDSIMLFLKYENTKPKDDPIWKKVEQALRTMSLKNLEVILEVMSY